MDNVQLIAADLPYFRRMRAGTVGTGQIEPPLPGNGKPGDVPGFLVSAKVIDSETGSKK